MADERERILKLLEDGRITADQAARLIEALGRQAVEPPVTPVNARVIRRRRLHGVERIPDIVAEAVASAIEKELRPGARRQEFAGVGRVVIKSVSGDVEVGDSGEDKVVVESSEAAARVQEEGGEVMVKAVSGDLKVLVPSGCRLELASVTGDVLVADLSGHVMLRAVSGDVTLLRVGGRIEVNTASGDVVIESAGGAAGAVRTVSGDVELGLEPGADVLVHARSGEFGSVGLALKMPHEVLEKSEAQVKVKLGAGSRLLEVSTRSGSIEIGEAEER
uniref:Uncharacterized protein n=1 Tax=candidate division WOR-3 bacterium TaxID=2052148 RepID=A0A7C4G9K7_UNCW3